MEVIISEQDAGRRLDQVLAEALGESRSRVQAWIRDGHVTIHNRTILPRTKPDAGTVVRIEAPAPVPDHVEAEELALNILYEDDDLLVLNKAAGMVVHPGAGARTGTLVAGLLHYCRGRLSGIGGVERPGIVHRLDKDTSGVMVVAKTDAAHRRLADDFQNRRVTKIYRAFVHRSPLDDHGTWDGKIGRHPVQRQKQAIRPVDGREARTDYSVLRRWAEVSLIECRLFTGRTHQIRVHAAHAGCPLIGDTTYGGKLNPAAGVQRQLLHSYHLGITHPSSGQALAFEAPLPDDFIHYESWLTHSTPRHSAKPPSAT